ncbi:hypothetical protein H1C71_026211, partial [Ictidomys tridecemlineatus]
MTKIPDKNDLKKKKFTFKAYGFRGQSMIGQLNYSGPTVRQNFMVEGHGRGKLMLGRKWRNKQKEPGTRYIIPKGMPPVTNFRQPNPTCVHLPPITVFLLNHFY